MKKNTALQELIEWLEKERADYLKNGYRDEAYATYQAIKKATELLSKEREDIKDMAILFQDYNRQFRQQESIAFKKACDKAGGIFSLADYGIANIYDDFINRKPIKCEWNDGGSQWEVDENYKLVHVVLQ